MSRVYSLDGKPGKPIRIIHVYASITHLGIIIIVVVVAKGRAYMDGCQAANLGSTLSTSTGGWVGYCEAIKNRLCLRRSRICPSRDGCDICNPQDLQT